MNKLAAITLLAMVCLGSSGPALAQAASGQTFKAWRYDCVTPKPAAGSSAGAQQAAPTCLIQHTVRRAGNDKSIVMMARVRLLGNPARPALVFLMPPALKAGAPIRYAVDGGAAAATTVRQCSKQVCWAVVPLDDNLLGAMKSGREMVVDMAPGTQNAAATVSLDGFTGAYMTLMAPR